MHASRPIRHGRRRDREERTAAAAARRSSLAGLGVLLAAALLPGAAAGQEHPPPPPPPSSSPKESSLPLLRPFPVVRIVGDTTSRGAKVTLMTVFAATGTYVASRCDAPRDRCPYKVRVSRIAGREGRLRTVRIRAFERSFRAGVLLRIYVAAPGRIGKYTSFRVRRARPPRRRDACIAGLVPLTLPCPA